VTKSSSEISVAGATRLLAQFQRKFDDAAVYDQYSHFNRYHIILLNIILN